MCSYINIPGESARLANAYCARLPSLAIPVVLLALCQGAFVCMATEPQERAVNEPSIDELVSGNRQPELFRVKSTGFKFGQRAPLFDPDYDWDEQARVLAAADDWAINASDRWLLLVEGLGDRRYSITWATRDGRKIQRCSIGRMCWHIIASQLTEPILECWPGELTESHGVFDVVKIPWPRMSAPQWARAKAVRALQMEMCEETIVRARETRVGSAEQRATFCERLMRLKQTIDSRQQAARVKGVRWYERQSGRIMFFDAASAERCRAAKSAIERDPSYGRHWSPFTSE